MEHVTSRSWQSPGNQNFSFFILRSPEIEHSQPTSRNLLASRRVDSLLFFGRFLIYCHGWRPLVLHPRRMVAG